MRKQTIIFIIIGHRLRVLRMRCSNWYWKYHRNNVIGQAPVNVTVTEAN